MLEINLRRQIMKKDIHPITVSRTDHMEEVGAMQLRDIYFYKTVQ